MLITHLFPYFYFKCFKSSKVVIEKNKLLIARLFPRLLREKSKEGKFSYQDETNLTNQGWGKEEHLVDEDEVVLDQEIEVNILKGEKIPPVGIITEEDHVADLTVSPEKNVHHQTIATEDGVNNVTMKMHPENEI